MTSGGFGLTQHRPINIWPQFFAPNGAARGTLNRWAVLSGHAPASLPHRRGLRGHADSVGQGGHATSGQCSLLDDGGVGSDFHIRECASITNERQDPGTIKSVSSIGQRIKEARLRLGISQVELAKRAGVSTGTIGNLEAGTRQQPRDLVPIAQALKVTPDWLFSGDEPSSGANPLGISLTDLPKSLYAYTVPPTKTREEIVAGMELGREFRYALEDDALAPELPKGTDLVWSTTKKPSVGSVVLVVDEHDQLHARRYAQGRSPSEWTARAPNPNYASLSADGLRIAAVAAYEMRAMP